MDFERGDILGYNRLVFSNSKSAEVLRTYGGRDVVVEVSGGERISGQIDKKIYHADGHLGLNNYFGKKIEIPWGDVRVAHIYQGVNSRDSPPDLNQLVLFSELCDVIQF